MALVLPRRTQVRVPLSVSLARLGLRGSNVLCLDVGDKACYPGSGTKLLDTSGGGYDFDFGDGSTASTRPTFNGTAGGLSSSEYLSFDGGDYLTYDSAPETWMKGLHKNGQAVSVMAVIRIPSDDNFYFFATETGSTANLGVGFLFSSALDKVLLSVVNASTITSVGAAAATISPPRTMFAGLSITQGAGNAYTVVQDATAATGTMSGSFTPSSSDSSTTPPVIGGRAGAASLAPSGARLYELAVWSGRELTSSEWLALFQARRHRYGI